MNFFSQNKSNKQRGVTMIELVISISVIAVVAMVLYPMLTAGIRAWTAIDENTTFTSEANAVWLYLRPLLATDGTITVANSSSVSFTSSGSTYLLSTIADGSLYKLVLTKNSGTAQTLASSLAILTSPPGPGLELRYYNSAGDITSTPNQVRAIDMTLSLQGRSNVHRFQSWVLVESQNLFMTR